MAGGADSAFSMEHMQIQNNLWSELQLPMSNSTKLSVLLVNICKGYLQLSSDFKRLILMDSVIVDIYPIIWVVD